MSITHAGPTRTATEPPSSSYAGGQRPRVAPDVTVGQNTQIDAGSIVDRGCKLGDNVTIGRAVFLGREVHVHAQARIRELAFIGSRVTIGRGADIGKGALIGHDCRIEEGAKVPAGSDVPDGHVVRRGKEPAAPAKAAPGLPSTANDRPTPPVPRSEVNEVHLAVWARDEMPELFEQIVAVRRAISGMQGRSIPDAEAWDIAHDQLDVLLEEVHLVRSTASLGS